MNPVMTALLVGIVVGLVLGSMLGRRLAEGARARHDMRQAWRNRRNYRK